MKQNQNYRMPLVVAPTTIEEAILVAKYWRDCLRDEITTPDDVNKHIVFGPSMHAIKSTKGMRYLNAIAEQEAVIESMMAIKNAKLTEILKVSTGGRSLNTSVQQPIVEKKVIKLEQKQTIVEKPKQQTVQQPKETKEKEVPKNLHADKPAEEKKPVIETTQAEIKFPVEKENSEKSVPTTTTSKVDAPVVTTKEKEFNDNRRKPNLEQKTSDPNKPIYTSLKQVENLTDQDKTELCSAWEASNGVADKEVIYNKVRNILNNYEIDLRSLKAMITGYTRSYRTIIAKKNQESIRKLIVQRDVPLVSKIDLEKLLNGENLINFLGQVNVESPFNLLLLTGGNKISDVNPNDYLIERCLHLRATNKDAEAVKDILKYFNADGKNEWKEEEAIEYLNILSSFNEYKPLLKLIKNILEYYNSIEGNTFKNGFKDAFKLLTNYSQHTVEIQKKNEETGKLELVTQKRMWGQEGKMRNLIAKVLEEMGIEVTSSENKKGEEKKENTVGTVSTGSNVNNEKNKVHAYSKGTSGNPKEEKPVTAGNSGKEKPVIVETKKVEVTVKTQQETPSNAKTEKEKLKELKAKHKQQEKVESTNKPEKHKYEIPITKNANGKFSVKFELENNSIEVHNLKSEKEARRAFREELNRYILKLNALSNGKEDGGKVISMVPNILANSEMNFYVIKETQQQMKAAN